MPFSQSLQFFTAFSPRSNFLSLILFRILCQTLQEQLRKVFFSGNDAVLLNEAISEHLLRQGHVDVADMLIRVGKYDLFYDSRALDTNNSRTS